MTGGIPASTIRSTGFSLVLMVALVGAGPKSLSGQKSYTAADSCLKIQDLGKRPDGTPILPSVLGRVLDFDGRLPVVGARLQMVGTKFGTFTDRNGEYRLAFDPRTFDRCRRQYIEVVAGGYAVARLVLKFVGDGARSADVVLRKH